MSKKKTNAEFRQEDEFDRDILEKHLAGIEWDPSTKKTTEKRGARYGRTWAPMPLGVVLEEAPPFLRRLILSIDVATLASGYNDDVRFCRDEDGRLIHGQEKKKATRRSSRKTSKEATSKPSAGKKRRSAADIDAELETLDFGKGLTKAQLKSKLNLSGRQVNALLSRHALRSEGEGRKTVYLGKGS